MSKKIAYDGKWRLETKYMVQYSRIIYRKSLEERLGIYDKLESNHEKVFNNILELTNFLKDLFSIRPKVFHVNDYIDEDGNFHEGNGTVYGTSEGLNLLSNDNGYSVVNAGSELFDFIYRGQTKYYPECKPTIFRYDERNGNYNLEKKLIDLTKAIVFEQIIDTHPYSKLVSDRKFIESLKEHPNAHFRQIGFFLSKEPLYINKHGIAQHYGFATNLLDTTSNIDVASFFATCEYDKRDRKFKITDSEQGIFYVIVWYLPKILDRFDIIGWQPFSRPEEQRAGSIIMGIEDDLNCMPPGLVYKFYFKQRPEISKRIYKRFKKGNTLFVNDEIDELARKVNHENEFDEQSIKMAYKKLINHFRNQEIKSFEEMYNSIKFHGISIRNHINLSRKYHLEFGGPKHYCREFYKLIYKLRYRPAAYQP